MERIKVGEVDHFQKQDINKRIRESENIINRSILIVKALTGRFDTDMLTDIINSDGKTRDELEKAMQEDISKLSSIIMRDELKSKLKVALNNFDKAANDIVNAVSSVVDIIPAQNWQIENNSLSVRGYREIMENATSIYIVGKQGAELYKRLENIAKELNSISDISRRYNILATIAPPLFRGLIDVNAKGEYITNGVLTASLVKEVFK